MQQLLQQPIYIRCDEITRWVEEYPVKDLECILPEIVDDIFGITNRVGWRLMNIEYLKNPQEYDIIYKFLNPNGPLFRLCYKLLSDPYLKYKFHLSFLPQKIRQSIEDGTASPFYMEKLEVDPRTRAPVQLRLNPFELFMFHFVYHVVNTSLRSHLYQDSTVSSLYLRLAEEYLCVFLPCDGSTVQPELPNHYISQSPHRSLPQKPVRTSMLFRQDVLTKMQSPAVNTLQTSPHVGIWRSELTVQLCVDLWLSMPNAESPTQLLWWEEQLPSCEHLHAVRLLVKHLHYFANSLVEDSSAMDQLKKVIIPSSQRRLYHFIRQNMQHWPLDSSFKQILEIWLSYIQPWRYLDFRARYNRVRTDPSAVDSRWLPFIADNLLVYSVIFHQLIDRFKMIDLASPRNAYMLFRLTKVFSQPNLCELLRQVEGSVGDMDGRGYSKWVQSHLVDLEGPSFQYKPILQLNSSVEACIRIAKEAECQALRIVEEEQKREEELTFWQTMFSHRSSVQCSMMEWKNVLIYLSASIMNLANMFQIPQESLDRMTRSLASTETTCKPANVHEMSPLHLKKSENELRYEGDPDLQPIRSFENTILVRILYYICSWINYNYSSQIISLYTRRDVLGGLARQLIRGPQLVYHFDKRMPGSPVRVPTSLPPRLSLRILANYYLLGYGGLLVFLAMSVFNLSFTAVTVSFLFLWIVFMVVRWMVGCAPVIPEVTIHDTSDSGHNVSFNG